MSYCISFEDVQQAAKRTQNLVHLTPVLTCSAIDEMANALSRHNSKESVAKRRFFFKVEAMQRTGSFKFRGALNAVLSVQEDVRQSMSESEGQRQLNVVTHSSGNHAQALALAALVASENTEMIHVNATIVMPKGAPEIKQRAVNGYGAKVVLVENTNEAREEEAERIRNETGAVFIHPSEDPRVIAGQGTAGLEMIQQIQELIQTGHLDAVIIPVGGGGLSSGNAIAFRGMLGNKIKIILAEPNVLNDAKRSKDSGKLLGHDADNKLDSVADGLKTTLGPNTWPIVRDLVDDIITVSEEDIIKATKIVWERLKVCIEPSAGVGVAVALSNEFAQKFRPEDGIENVGIILCGGNVDIVKVAKIMA